MILHLNSKQASALRNLRWSAQCMRGLTVGYTLWVLWKILSLWLDADRVTRGYGSYLGLDLSGMAVWQRLVPLGLDLFSWSLLLGCVFYAWMLLGNVKNGVVFSKQNATHFKRCAWMGIACQASTLLTRPLLTYCVSAHLPAGQQAFRWGLGTADLLGVILCLAILMFAFVYGWALDIAEENQEFV